VLGEERPEPLEDIGRHLEAILLVVVVAFQAVEYLRVVEVVLEQIRLVDIEDIGSVEILGELQVRPVVRLDGSPPEIAVAPVR
jgi:hypothetical protein